jgi:hypothetical protein
MVLEFPRPDAGSRAILWKLHIPDGAPCSKNIDHKLLGKEINLTGGQIRNAAIHAAFLAAGESSDITIGHISRAVWTELTKEGGELITSRLGLLAEYIPNEAINAAY